MPRVKQASRFVSMSKSRLVEILESRGKSTKGRRDQLIARLENKPAPDLSPTTIANTNLVSDAAMVLTVVDDESLALASETIADAIIPLLDEIDNAFDEQIEDFVEARRHALASKRRVEAKKKKYAAPLLAAKVYLDGQISQHQLAKIRLERKRQQRIAVAIKQVVEEEAQDAQESLVEQIADAFDSGNEELATKLESQYDELANEDVDAIVEQTVSQQRKVAPIKVKGSSTTLKLGVDVIHEHLIDRSYFTLDVARLTRDANARKGNVVWGKDSGTIESLPGIVVYDVAKVRVVRKRR